MSGLAARSRHGLHALRLPKSHAPPRHPTRLKRTKTPLQPTRTSRETSAAVNPYAYRGPAPGSTLPDPCHTGGRRRALPEGLREEGGEGFLVRNASLQHAILTLLSVRHLMSRRSGVIPRPRSRFRQFPSHSGAGSPENKMLNIGKCFENPFDN
jgi:hypothetical protein